jgi:hypothetical protein
VDGVLTHLRGLADLGVQWAIFNMPEIWKVKPLETIGSEIIPAVADW